MTDRLATAGLSGAALGLAGVVGALCFEAVASIEGIDESIDDARARQVTALLGCWLLAAWIVGVAANARRFVAVAVGAFAATLVVSVALVAVASLPAVVVTPPAAWLIVTAASVLGGLAVERLHRGVPGAGDCDGAT